MKPFFFITAGLMFLSVVQAHAKPEIITDATRKEGIYSRVHEELKTSPFVCVSGAILEAADGMRRVSIGIKKDGQWTQGLNIYLTDSSNLYLNQGQQPVLSVVNFFRGNSLVNPDTVGDRFIDGDQVTTAYFTTTSDYQHVTRVQFLYKVYKTVDTGNLIDPSKELREIEGDAVLDCSRP